MDDPRDLLEKRIVTIMNKLELLTPGTPEHQKATEDLNRLYEVMIKEDKARSEMKIAEEKLNDEQLYRVEDRADELKRDKVSNIFKGVGLGMTAIGGVATFLYNCVGHRMLVEAETEGKVIFASRAAQFLKDIYVKFRK